MLVPAAWEGTDISQFSVCGGLFPQSFCTYISDSALILQSSSGVYLIWRKRKLATGQSLLININHVFFPRFPLMLHDFWKHKASGKIPCKLSFSNVCWFGYKLILQQCRRQTTLWKVLLPVVILPASFPACHGLCLHFPNPNGVCPHLLCPALPDSKLLLLFIKSLLL